MDRKYKTAAYREKCIKRLEKFYKVNPQTRCWEWQGPRWSHYKGTDRAPNDYGMFSFGMKWRLAHRVSYALHNEDIELLSNPNIFCCHKCDNRKCVNPKHLFLGTHHDNMQDMINKGRGPKRLEHLHCPHCKKKL